MINYFQIQDFFAINSDNIEEELKKIRVRIKEFPTKVEFWNNAHPEETAFLANALNENSQGVNVKNFLSITLAEFIANNDFVERFIRAAFNENFKSGCAFPIPNKMFSVLDLDVRVVPKSVQWNLKGRILSINFDTFVKLTNPLPELTDREMDQGMDFYSTDARDSLRIIFHLLLEPNSLELVRSDEKSPYRFAIRKSNNLKIGLNKLFWQYHAGREADSMRILDIIKFFAQDIFKKFNLDFRKFNALLRVSSEIDANWRPQIFVINGHYHYDSLQEFLEDIKVLLQVEKDSLESFNHMTIDDMCKQRKEFKAGYNTLVFRMNTDSKTKTAEEVFEKFQEHGEKLRFDIDMLGAIVEFLEGVFLPTYGNEHYILHSADNFDAHGGYIDQGTRDTYCDTFAYHSAAFRQFILDHIIDAPEKHSSPETGGNLCEFAKQLHALKQICD